jgi:hypothetical protein
LLERSVIFIDIRVLQAGVIIQCISGSSAYQEEQEKGEVDVDAWQYLPARDQNHKVGNHKEARIAHARDHQ